jgi:hypothetical protein
MFKNIIHKFAHNYIMTGKYKPVTKQNDKYIWQDGFEWEFKCSKCPKIIWRKLRTNEI